MLQLYPEYSLWNGWKTLTGSPDPMHMQEVQINLALGLVMPPKTSSANLNINDYLNIQVVLQVLFTDLNIWIVCNVFIKVLDLNAGTDIF